MQMEIALIKRAKELMVEKGLDPEFSHEELQELAGIDHPAPIRPTYQDLRSYLWCSIDNDDSEDLDQLTYAERNGERVTIWIAVADVDSLVKKNSAIDQRARLNTTSVYTSAMIFPMLPEKLSTNLTSLNEHEERLALVVRMELNVHGEIEASEIFQAAVYNHAKLSYNSVGPWMEKTASIPEKVESIPGLKETLLVQNEAAQSLRKKRHRLGSLTLQSAKAEARVHDDKIEIQVSSQNLAHQLVEEFMVAANGTVAEHLEEAKVPSLRRVVKTPKNWHRIVEVAQMYGDKLPEEPDSKALDAFLIRHQKKDPENFPDLSLTIIKLLGRGEYAVEHGGSEPTSHFALALTAYTHSTAPNRRYPDLVTQRQYKALLNHQKNPYSYEELKELAAHCTKQEDAATKVERQMTKIAAAMLLAPRIGQTFQGIITGASDKGTWIRIFEPPVEGKVVQGFKGLDVGDKVRVVLKKVDVEQGFIDFVRA